MGQEALGVIIPSAWAREVPSIVVAMLFQSGHQVEFMPLGTWKGSEAQAAQCEPMVSAEGARAASGSLVLSEEGIIHCKASILVSNMVFSVTCSGGGN